MLGITEYVSLWLSFWSSWRAWTWAETTCSSNMESTRPSNPKVYHYQPPTALAPGEMYKKDIRKTGRGPFQRSQIIYEYIIPVDFVPDLRNQINRCDVYFAATSNPIRWNITIHIDYILIRLIPDKTLAGWCWMVLPPSNMAGEDRPEVRHLCGWKVHTPGVAKPPAMGPVVMSKTMGKFWENFGTFR